MGDTAPEKSSDELLRLGLLATTSALAQRADAWVADTLGTLAHHFITKALHEVAEENGLADAVRVPHRNDHEDRTAAAVARELVASTDLDLDPARQDLSNGALFLKAVRMGNAAKSDKTPVVQLQTATGEKVDVRLETVEPSGTISALPANGATTGQPAVVTPAWLNGDTQQAVFGTAAGAFATWRRDHGVPDAFFHPDARQYDDSRRIGAAWGLRSTGPRQAALAAFRAWWAPPAAAGDEETRLLSDPCPASELGKEDAAALATFLGKDFRPLGFIAAEQIVENTVGCVAEIGRLLQIVRDRMRALQAIDQKKNVAKFAWAEQELRNSKVRLNERLGEIAGLQRGAVVQLPHGGRVTDVPLCANAQRLFDLHWATGTCLFRTPLVVRDGEPVDRAAVALVSAQPWLRPLVHVADRPPEARFRGQWWTALPKGVALRGTEGRIVPFVLVREPPTSARALLRAGLCPTDNRTRFCDTARQVATAPVGNREALAELMWCGMRAVVTPPG